MEFDPQLDKTELEKELEPIQVSTETEKVEPKPEPKPTVKPELDNKKSRKATPEAKPNPTVKPEPTPTLANPTRVKEPKPNQMALSLSKKRNK